MFRLFLYLNATFLPAFGPLNSVLLFLSNSSRDLLFDALHIISVSEVYKINRCKYFFKLICTKVVLQS